MRRLHRLLAALIAGTLAVATPAAVADDPPRRDEALRAELLRRVDEDQAARKAALAKSPPDPEVVKAGEAVDRKNTAWLKGVVESRGWPGKSLVGADGAHAAWLLVQHADRDRDFQRRCLGLLRDAHRDREATGEDLAYLTDRVLVGEGKKQLYGTQFHQAADGSLEPDPLEDEPGLDRRRKEVGLMPMATYKALMRAVYKGKPQSPGR